MRIEKPDSKPTDGVRGIAGDKKNAPKFFSRREETDGLAIARLSRNQNRRTGRDFNHEVTKNTKNGKGSGRERE